MKRAVYEAPLTELFRVELEGAFMSASVVQEKGSTVKSTGHEVGGEFDMSGEGFTVTWGGEEAGN